MPISIVPHALDWKDSVERFNSRMRQAGSRWGFYVDPVPSWIPRRGADQRVWREYWLVVEDGLEVRGGFALKPQDWWVRGERVTVADWQGPVSEGAVDPRYGALGLRLLRDMLKKQPLLYSWGHGGDDEPIIQLLRSLQWTIHGTPLAVRVLRPHRFLRHNAFLRKKPERRLALDIAAFTGVGSLGLRALHLGVALRHRPVRTPAYEPVRSFGPWADEVWEAARGDYDAVAFRDSRSLNALMPADAPPREWSAPMPLRVTRGDRTLGWIAVCARRMKDEPRFGNLHVGTLVDYFARPEDAPAVLAAGVDYLRRRSVDLVIANQSDPRWQHAMQRNGFVLVPGRRLFAASPPLIEKLRPFETTSARLFLTNMDGHGPMGL